MLFKVSSWLITQDLLLLTFSPWSEQFPSEDPLSSFFQILTQKSLKRILSNSFTCERERERGRLRQREKGGYNVGEMCIFIQMIGSSLMVDNREFFNSCEKED